ncbi:hypothetical protein Rumeso_00742 [Rubellimicrobium mesophilum DSM 19309]|uniref:Uncharacterized protein n=1 Tax=Rubellimicrobium mesophilum DSM 19309 TaxID=442562 RepID=A0A017HT89_9RHOB|nr:hypothetical protein Rumeso_00742 [Rubellimicrobium mesophilum DSM 19309]
MPSASARGDLLDGDGVLDDPGRLQEDAVPGLAHEPDLAAHGTLEERHAPGVARGRDGVVGVARDAEARHLLLHARAWAGGVCHEDDAPALAAELLHGRHGLREGLEAVVHAASEVHEGRLVAVGDLREAPDDLGHGLRRP